MSIYVGTYKAPEEQVRKWITTRAKLVVMENPIGELTFEDAIKIVMEHDTEIDAIYKLAESDLKKMGFNFQRGDVMSFGFEYSRLDCVVIWMEKGDNEVPSQKTGFGAKA